MPFELSLILLRVPVSKTCPVIWEVVLASNRCFWSSSSKPFLSTVNPFSLRIDSVISNGKPYVSYNLKASRPGSALCLFFCKVSMSSSKMRVPCSRVSWNFSSSLFTIRAIFSLRFLISGYCSCIISLTIGTNLYKKQSFMPSCVPSRMARLNNRLSTYPRPSLPGSTPSEIQNTQAFTWSAIRRISTACANCPLYFTFVISSRHLIIGLKMSMSKLVCTPCMTRAILSNPMPVSTFLCGNSSSLPPSLR